jgi:hypothetical protein
VGVAGLALAGTMLGGGSVVAQAGTPADRVEEPCLQAPSAARVDGRLSRHGDDPNSVTAAAAARMDAALQRQRALLLARGRITAKGAPTLRHDAFRIDTHVHVITRSDGSGGVTDAQVQAQVAVLNKAFAGRSSAQAARSPFRFVLKSVDRVPNDDWFDWANPDEDPSDDQEAKAATRVGGRDDLNVWIANLAPPLLGYADFPSEPLETDGLVLLNESLPGGAAAPYNEGDTATHEVGHWLGLFHSFENGCNRPGDYVWDTPYQDDGDNIFECDESLDTCKQPGLDPVHNFMSYGDDPCLDRFSRGQVLRMVVTWLAFRLGQ